MDSFESLLLLFEMTDKLNVPLSFSKSKVEKAKRLASDKLLELYPQTAGREIFSHVLGPMLGGSQVSSNTFKFSTKLSCVSDVEVRIFQLFLRLFLCFVLLTFIFLIRL